jgi:hypothetical protein
MQSRRLAVHVRVRHQILVILLRLCTPSWWHKATFDNVILFIIKFIFCIIVIEIFHLWPMHKKMQAAGHDDYHQAPASLHQSVPSSTCHLAALSHAQLVAQSNTFDSIIVFCSAHFDFLFDFS